MVHSIHVNTIKQLNSKVALYCKLVDVEAERITIELTGNIIIDKSKKAKPRYAYRERINMAVYRSWNIVEYEYFFDPHGSGKPDKILQIRNCWIQFGDKD